MTWHGDPERGCGLMIVAALVLVALAMIGLAAFLVRGSRW